MIQIAALDGFKGEGLWKTMIDGQEIEILTVEWNFGEEARIFGTGHVLYAGERVEKIEFGVELDHRVFDFNTDYKDMLNST